jgi:hypothetical protein
LRAGESVAMCLGTAAAAYGFDTEERSDLHVVNPVRHQLRNSDGLIVHRREGAPLTRLTVARPQRPNGPLSRSHAACVVRVLLPRSTLPCAAARVAVANCPQRPPGKPADAASFTSAN